MTATWEQVLTAIEQRVPEGTFDRWFRPLSAKEDADGSFSLLADDEFDAVFLEKNFSELIRLHLEQITGYRVELHITHTPDAGRGNNGALVRSDESQAAPPPPRPARANQPTAPRTNGVVQSSTKLDPPAPADPPREQGPDFDAFTSATPTISPVAPTVTERILEAGLKLQYSFEQFVVGGSNEFAHAAALAVHEKPGRVYNPLFLYGSVGLGKTHLLNAVGIELLRTNPACRVRYMTSEAFMNEMIEDMRSKNMGAFRSRFRDGLDALLIDDIQFIAGKDSTQREFFHTFNALHQAGAQIVITSDRYPHEIPDLEERLQSRFQWGLIADIQVPGVETRLAILKQKAANINLELPDDAALFLAENIRSNVRELEGALLRLHAFGEFNNRAVTLGLVKNLLRRFIQENNRQITVEAVQKAVCAYYNIKLSDLKGKSRQRAISRPRQIAMHLAKKLTGQSYPQLGEKFGGRDHTTILSGCRKIKGMVETDKTIASAVQHLEKGLTRQ